MKIEGKLIGACFVGLTTVGIVIGFEVITFLIGASEIGASEIGASEGDFEGFLDGVKVGLFVGVKDFEGWLER